MLICGEASELHLFSSALLCAGSHQVTREALGRAKAQEVAAGAMCTVKTTMMISMVNSLSSVDQTPNQATLYRENPTLMDSRLLHSSVRTV